jgi:hypothetical protein
LIIVVSVLALAWMAWQIIFVEKSERREQRTKKGPIRIMTEISPGLGVRFWQSRRKR